MVRFFMVGKKAMKLIVLILILITTLLGCSDSEEHGMEDAALSETEITNAEKNESKGEVAMYDLDSKKEVEQSTNSEAMSEEEVKMKIDAELKEIRKSLDEMPFETHIFDVIEKEIDSMGKVYFLNIVTVDKRMRSTLYLHDSEFNEVDSFGKWQNGADILTVEVGDFNNDGLDDIYVNTYARGVDQSFEESKNDMRGQYGWFYLQTETGEFYDRNFIDLTNIPRTATPYDIILVKEIWDEQSSLPRQILSDKNGYLEFDYENAVDIDFDNLGKVKVLTADVVLGDEQYPILYIVNDKNEILRSFGKFDSSIFKLEKYEQKLIDFEIKDLNGDGLKDIYVRIFFVNFINPMGYYDTDIDTTDPIGYQEWEIIQTKSGVFDLKRMGTGSLKLNEDELFARKYTKGTNEKPAIQGKSITEPTQEEILSSNAPIESGISINSKSVVIECSGDVAMQAYLKPNDAFKVGIIGLGISIKDELLGKLYSSFQFPEASYKETQEDIVKGLKNLNWLDTRNFELYIWDFKDMMIGNNNAKAKIIDVLRNDVASYWKEQEGFSFDIYLANG